LSLHIKGIIALMEGDMWLKAVACIICWYDRANRTHRTIMINHQRRRLINAFFTFVTQRLTNCSTYLHMIRMSTVRVFLIFTMGEVLCFDGRIIMEMQRNREHCHQTSNWCRWQEFRRRRAQMQLHCTQGTKTCHEE
jgi:hypothetical protein